MTAFVFALQRVGAVWADNPLAANGCIQTHRQAGSAHDRALTATC